MRLWADHVWQHVRRRCHLNEVDREFPLEYTFENISSDELEVTSQGGLEDISSDELEEINITLENVSEGDFDI